MIIFIIAGILLGFLNSALVNAVFLKNIKQANSDFLKKWGLAFFYKLGLLIVFFFIFRIFELPYMLTFLISFIVAQILGQLIFIRKINQ